MVRSLIRQCVLPFDGLSVVGSHIRIAYGGLVVTTARVPPTVVLSIYGSNLVVIGSTACVSRFVTYVVQQRLRVQRLFESRRVRIYGRMQNFLGGNVRLARLFKINNEFAMPLVVGLWPSRLKFNRKKFTILIRTGRGACASVFVHLLIRLVRFNVFTNKGINIAINSLGRVKASKKTKQKR